jgi:hypothetical protein
MRPHRHFCGMVAAASEPPFPSMPGHCWHFCGKAPMHQRSAPDSKGMDTFAPQERC